MDEFRKAYEYEEENGVSGYLLLFLLTLLSFDLTCAVIIFMQSSMVIEAETDVLLLHQLLWAAYGVTKLVFCILLFVGKPFVVKFAHAFLFIRVLVFSLSIIVTCTLVLANFDQQILSIETKSRWDVTYLLLITPLVYTLLYSIGWGYYFRRSKRVKNFYGSKEPVATTLS